MKKLALFLGGIVTGLFVFGIALGWGEDMYDETLYENEEYTITKAADKTKKGKVGLAVINYE